MKLFNRPLLLVTLIFILKLISVLYLINLLKSSGSGHFIGFANMSGDANSYITPIDNFLSESQYYYGNSKAGRMPYVGLLYYLFRLLFSKTIALTIVVIFQTIVESIAIYYMAKLCYLIFKTQKAFWMFLFLSIISLHVTTYDYYILSESLGISFLCLFTYHYYIFLSQQRTTMRLVVSGLFLALSILFKPYLSPLFILIGLEFLWHNRANHIAKNLKMTIFSSILVSLPLVVINTPWTIRNYIVMNKFVPFQVDIDAGYDYPTSTLAVYKFIQTIGESYLNWDTRSAGCFFEPRDGYQCEYRFPKRIFSANLTMDNIEEAKNIYLEYQLTPNDSLNELTVQKFNALAEIYKKESSFSYYFMKPFILCKHFLFHNSGSCYLPVPKNSAGYHHWFLMLLKLSQSILYYLDLIIGTIGSILLFRYNSKSFMIVAIPMYLILLFPIILARTEFRYFHPAYPFLLIGLIFILINGKKIIKCIVSQRCCC